MAWGQLGLPASNRPKESSYYELHDLGSVTSFPQEAGFLLCNRKGWLMWSRGRVPLTLVRVFFATSNSCSAPPRREKVFGGSWGGGVKSHRFPLPSIRPALSPPVTFPVMPGLLQGTLGEQHPRVSPLQADTRRLQQALSSHFSPWEPPQLPLLPCPHFTNRASGKWPQDLGTNKNRVGSGSSGHPPAPRQILSLPRGMGGAVLAVHWPGAGHPQARGLPQPSPPPLPTPPIPAARPASLLPPRGRSPRQLGVAGC